MQGIFDPQWITHHRQTVQSAELAEIRITRAGGEVVWTPETGTTGGEDIVLFEGTCRWQKVGRPTKRDFVEDFALFNAVRVQISIEKLNAYRTLHNLDFRFEANDKVELVGNKSNPDSEGDVVYYWGDPTSGNAWHHTLMCQQNMKQVG